ncbi:MAG TPA: biotin/lipoyl-containing protein, partial [Solirubrobacteraceae bacterium]
MRALRAFVAGGDGACQARLPERSLPRLAKVRRRGRGSHRPAVGSRSDRRSRRLRVHGGGYRGAVPVAPSTQEDAVADVEAHITGTVWKIECEVGDEVEEGDTVVILESMKMEMPVEAEDAGVVK